MPSDTENEEENVAQVGIKVPSFMEAAVPAWFHIIEAQFHLKKIKTEKTKFFHTLSNLPPDIVSRISTTELESQNYTTLKDSVISLFERSKTEMFNELLSKTTLVGKPSIFLRDMMSKAAKLNINNDIVRMKFIQALPLGIRPVVAAQTSLDLDQLGVLANDLASLAPAVPIAAVASPSPSPAANSVPSSGSNLPPGLRPFGRTQRPKVCRAHLYFAEKARSCKPWCQWPNKAGVTMQPSSRPASPSSSRASSPTRQSSSENI